MNKTLGKALDNALAALRRPDAKLVRQHGGTAAGFYVWLPHNSFRVPDEVAAKLLERNDVQPFDSGLPGFGGPQSWRLGNWRNWEASAMNARTRLPNRRLAESFTFECAGLKYTATVGRFADGSVGEIFISNNKSNSQADISARDAAIVFSIAVQYGTDIEAITQALSRDGQGNPSGPLATALDILANGS